MSIVDEEKEIEKKITKIVTLKHLSRNNEGKEQRNFYHKIKK